MPGFVLDTNVYISADRDPDWATELARFSRLALPRTFLHAVVAQELLAGAIGGDRRRDLYDALIAPFDRRRRLITPSFRTWAQSGEVIADLVESRRISPGGFTRSFLNDVMLAASCREHGLTLITRNVADFQRIGTVLDFDYAAPWPPS